jgi:hypothetical protein
MSKENTNEELETEDLTGRRLLKLNKAMKVLDIDDYKTLKSTLKKENIPIINWGGSPRVDLHDIEKRIEEKKSPLAS